MIVHRRILRLETLSTIPQLLSRYGEPVLRNDGPTYRDRLICLPQERAKSKLAHLTPQYLSFTGTILARLIAVIVTLRK